ncbi:hypothetical protein [Natrarchaeobius chitinivorans]|uniref:Uncharacterized protein n=1 Tax=Natrarchaeobius chitinivorans TaxID=1679083 RepID=A0A3N6N333_NATCH|nr:hypothetical protein [Natrarchaeobius chitinivorans]RQG92482.1 hypothetical protein EA473_15800 [Natrarchaeobius chitinivorans]
MTTVPTPQRVRDRFGTKIHLFHYVLEERTSPKSLAPAAIVALLAGATEAFVRHATVLGIEVFDLGVEATSLVAPGANAVSLLVTPIAVFAVGYHFARAADDYRATASLAAVLFLVAAITSAAVQIGLGQYTASSYVSVGHGVLVHLETAVSTGLAVTVAGLAGVGTHLARNGPARPDSASSTGGS